ncbi:MAG: hypothetical protein VX196_02755 [Pseudomonadota bacterium]|nr:hypothetical protein [Pseudomonadota bacterium]
MAKVGLRLKIDVTKIDKARLFKGQKGTYLDATIFVDLDQQDEYGNNGMITQSWKDQQKGEGAILGNGSIFWRDQSAPAQGNAQPQQQQAPQGGQGMDFDDDIPFSPIGLQYRGILSAM